MDGSPEREEGDHDGCAREQTEEKKSEGDETKGGTEMTWRQGKCGKARLTRHRGA